MVQRINVCISKCFADSLMNNLLCRKVSLHIILGTLQFTMEELMNLDYWVLCNFITITMKTIKTAGNHLQSDNHAQPVCRLGCCDILFLLANTYISHMHVFASFLYLSITCGLCLIFTSVMQCYR